MRAKKPVGHLPRGDSTVILIRAAARSSRILASGPPGADWPTGAALLPCHPTADKVVTRALLLAARGVDGGPVGNQLAATAIDDMRRNGPYFLGEMANRGVSPGDLIGELRRLIRLDCWSLWAGRKSFPDALDQGPVTREIARGWQHRRQCHRQPAHMIQIGSEP